MAVSFFPCHHDSRSNPTPARGGKADESPPRCDDLDYIHFLIAAQKVFTCTEAARCASEGERTPAHDAFTRLLQRQPPDTWQEAKAFVDMGKGLLVLDDTTLDKPYAQKMDLVRAYQHSNFWY